MGSRGPKKGKGGRPREEVDPEEIEKLASIHCTNEEIAAVLGVSEDTITRNFADRIKSGKARGRASLRRRQWASSEPGKAGSVSALIWLGKQLLGQKDQIEQTNKDGDAQLTDEQLKAKIESMINQRNKK